MSDPEVRKDEKADHSRAHKAVAGPYRKDQRDQLSNVSRVVEELAVSQENLDCKLDRVLFVIHRNGGVYCQCVLGISRGKLVQCAGIFRRRTPGLVTWVVQYIHTCVENTYRREGSPVCGDSLKCCLDTPWLSYGSTPAGTQLGWNQSCLPHLWPFESSLVSRPNERFLGQDGLFSHVFRTYPIHGRVMPVSGCLSVRDVRGALVIAVS